MITLANGKKVTEEEFYTWSAIKQQRSILSTSDHQKQMASVTHKGKTLSDETKAKLRAANLGKVGHRHSEETVNRIAEKNRGKKRSVDTKEKMVAGWTARRDAGIENQKKSDAHKANMHAYHAKRRIDKLLNSSEFAMWSDLKQYKMLMAVSEGQHRAVRLQLKGDALFERLDAAFRDTLQAK